MRRLLIETLLIVLMLSGAILLFMGLLGLRLDWRQDVRLWPVYLVAGLGLMIGTIVLERRMLRPSKADIRAGSLKTWSGLLGLLGLLTLVAAAEDFLRFSPEKLLRAIVLLAVSAGSFWGAWKLRRRRLAQSSGPR